MHGTPCIIVAISIFIGALSCKQRAPIHDLRHDESLEKFFGTPHGQCTITAPFKAPPTAALALVAPAQPAPQAYLRYKNLLLRGDPRLLSTHIAPLLPESSPISEDKIPALPPEVQSRQLQVLTQNETTSSLDYSLTLAGIPLCDFSPKVIHHAEPLGHFEMGESLAHALDTFPENFAALTGDMATGKLTWKNDDAAQWAEVLMQAHHHMLAPAAPTSSATAEVVHPFGLYESKACLFREAKGLVPGWQLASYFPDRRPYRVLVKEHTLAAVIPLFFHASGTASIYQYGSSDSLTTVSLGNDLEDNGFLCSKELTTTVPPDQAVAHSASFSFAYPPDDFRFNEVSAFAHVGEMFRWFLEKNPKANWAETQVEIYLTEDPNILRAGPSYENPVFKSLSRPRIVAPLRLLQGDKTLLINLATDADALPHELGHHILFQYVGISSVEEHRILHEAIADAFVFFKSGDPCLGEILCPAGSSLCTYGPQRSCLRTAENSLNYTGDEYQQTLAGNIHMRGQLITGMLWDLYRVKNIPLRYLGDLLYKAISFLPRETNFSDFILALQIADAKLSKGANACTIAEVATTRGLQEKLSKIACEKFQQSRHPEASAK